LPFQNRRHVGWSCNQDHQSIHILHSFKQTIALKWFHLFWEACSKFLGDNIDSPRLFLHYFAREPASTDKFSDKMWFNCRHRFSFDLCTKMLWNDEIFSSHLSFNK
jgi:hypothetical protein